MLATISWSFKRVTLVMAGALFTTVFEDGHRKVQDFLPEIEKEANWNQAWCNGYGNDLLRYYQEHDFVHHWLAERLHDGISEAIRFGDDAVSVADASLSIKYEELMVHRMQQTIRMPDASPEWMHAWEGVDGKGLAEDLKADLLKCFGSMDLYPGSNALARHEQYFGEVYTDPTWIRIVKV